MIDHTLLDLYEKSNGDPGRLPQEERIGLEPAWTVLDELSQDLHMIRHGYTTEGYAKHVERLLKKECADDSVVDRLRAMRL
jgi:hypothetical protein